jgi:hypothetical protein
MQEVYNINRFSYIPSVFGANKRKFFSKDDYFVENSTDYYKVLSKQIKIKLKEVNLI